VELSATPPAFTPTVSDRPLASPLARWQAARGATVTNLRHDNQPLDDAHRALVILLDGTRDRAALVEQVVRELERDPQAMAGAPGAEPHPANLRDAVGSGIDHALADLARLALLMK
jgi:hypothetical protein